MKRDALVHVLHEERRVDKVQQEVVIRTSSQLLPNASYDFEVSVENGADGPIVLTPTIRRES